MAELHAGQDGDFFALLADKRRRTTRVGKPYYRVTFRDATRQLSAPVWSDSDWYELFDQWAIGMHFKIRGVVVQTDYGEELKIHKIRPVNPTDQNDGFDPSAFVTQTRFDLDEMFNELVDIAEREIADIPLAMLVVKILHAHEPSIRQIPAATHNHHAFAGGYLEHVRQVTRNAVLLADQYVAYYPDVSLSKSLVVAGAILHDIGKVRELEYRPTQSAYSVEGRLLGHMLLGRDIVREVAPDIEGLSPDTLLQLEHIIAAHHEQREFGAAVEPATIECMIVHHVDDLDAKVNMIVQALAKDTGTEPFTSRDNGLRRTLYKKPAPEPQATSALGEVGA